MEHPPYLLGKATAGYILLHLLPFSVRMLVVKTYVFCVLRYDITIFCNIYQCVRVFLSSSLCYKKNEIYPQAQLAILFISGHFANPWHIRIDALLKAILRSVAHNSQFAELESLFGALQLPRFSFLLVHTVVTKYCWRFSFKLPRSAIRFLRDCERFNVPRVNTQYS